MADLIGCEKNIHLEEISELESSLKSQLPQEFKEHYLRHNGGFLDETDVNTEQWGLPLGGFNPIKYGKLTIETLMKDIGSIIVEEENLTWHYGDLVPFAYDNGGNTVFLSLIEPTLGNVFVYAMDGNNLFKVSDTFSDFLKRLYKKLR